MTTEPLLRSESLSKRFQHQRGVLEVLREINLSVYAGEIVAIVGRSGAGKSTLLHVLGGLDAPSEGRVLLAGKDLYRMSDTSRSRQRACTLGFVFQAYYLLPEFTALENVLLAGLIAGMSESAATERASALLCGMGLGSRLDHRPAELSGGESQRVGIARALVNKPAIVFADEPTGNLDRQGAEGVLEEMSRIVRQDGGSLVLVTHDPQVSAVADRVLTMDDGRING